MHQKAKVSHYVLELTGAMVLYGIVLSAAIRVAPGLPADGLKLIVCVSPMLPIGLAIWAMARHFRRVDEYLKLVILENLAFAAAVTAGASLTYGFLENAGLPKISMFVVWPVMGAVWGVVACLRAFRDQ